jgi:long-chain-fatty-acid--CoA ligase ACSBG
MSETSGPQTLVNVMNHSTVDDNLYNSAGQTLSGTNIIIDNPDKDGNGEMCFKGRNRFVGYHNNLQETRKTIDSNGLLHSGDIGKLDS